MSRFTENQRKAIELRGNVLVVAGAGTGKTRTLVQRCVEWLLADPGVNSLDQVLMVTFTEAAAAEMRRRIREALNAEQKDKPGNPHLIEQLALLDTAFISTLHSFCLRLVKQHFYELDLDPQLAVLAQEDAHLLAEETLSNALEKHYKANTPQATAVQRLIQVQGRGWDLPVKRLIFQLHAYTQTLPDPDGWLTRQRDLFSKPEPDHWREWLTTALEDWKRFWVPALQTVGRETPNVAECLAALSALPAAPGLPDAQIALTRICEACQLNWPRGSIKAVRDRIEDFFREAEFLEGLTKAESPTPEGVSDEAEKKAPLVQDWDWVRPEMITLLDLTREFSRDFAEAKRELGAVDFHDLEQFSLRLLWDLATGRPTALAREWRTKLRLVLVDEYQDINAAQDAILRALGGEGSEANRFLVGDPKQSIYRFRLADPHIFQAYTAEWRQDASQGEVVPLTDNFRAREALLEFINAFFAEVMKSEIGGVPYDELAWLRFGNPAERKELSMASAMSENEPASGSRGRHVEVHLRLTAKSDSDSAADHGDDSPDGAGISRTSAEMEARLVGLRLLELREKKPLIWDASEKRSRPADWRDMVILLRSPQSKAEAYAKEFSRLGIPLLAARGGFFDSQEIMDVLSLLQLLDNPLQDVPLLAVLRSPFARLSFDELAMIRLCSKGRFWTALLRFHRLLRGGAENFKRIHTPVAPETNPGPLQRFAAALNNLTLRNTADAAWQKIDLFLRQYGQWRRLARETSLSQCLDRILDETRYAAFLLGEARGQQQRGNLAKLQGWARRFDQFQHQGLYRFLKFIQAQKDAQVDHESAPLDTAQTVRLMSIHQSKGLEFNVVVVADLGKAFNMSDLRAGIILDQQYGLCPSIKPPFTEQRYPSLPHWLAQRRQRQETLGEEMRLLYVAVTRACQYLILAGTATRSAAERWQQQCAPPTIREILSSAGCLDWLGPWIGRHTARPDWTQQAEGEGGLLRWVIYENDDARLQVDQPTRADVSSNPPPPLAATPAATEKLVERLRWKYPFDTAVGQAAKLSVSTLRLGILAEVDGGARKPRRRVTAASAGTASTLSAAAAGAAHHSFLEFASLDAMRDTASLADEAMRLEESGILTADERQALDLEGIAAFWRSNIGQDFLTQRKSLHRELPFTSRLSLRELADFQGSERAALGETPRQEAPSGPGASAEDDFVIVTGVVDLIALLPKEIWLLDFKSDAVDGDEWKAIARRYEPQIRMYALALSRIYSRPVTRAWLHALRPQRTLAVGLDSPDETDANSLPPGFPRGKSV